ncbi:hypothetical protein C0215_19175 [Clostridioides difficile]|nr:hypothetical protein C0215_19175 [Clostridioides difficile]
MPKSPGKAGRLRDLGPELESPGRGGPYHGPSGTGRRRPGKSGDPKGLWTQGQSRPGQLVDPAVRRSKARVSQESCVTPWALGARPESPGTSG